MQSMSDSTQKTILVVDDAEELTKVIGDMLEYKHYRVLIAHNGTDAIALAKKEHPDLTLLDLRMPDVSGYDVVRELRKDDWGKTAKFLILTATDFLDERPTDLGLAPSDYLAKSMWGISEVATRIEKKLTE